MSRVVCIFLLLFVLGACSEEDALTPSGKDKDWFVIEDDSDSPVDKAIYAFYEKWGVPIFYNDTIGYDTEVMYDGETDTLYKVLNINYTINSQGNNVVNKYFSLVKEQDALLAGVKFLDQYLYPQMPEIFHQTSLFLVDSLYESQYVGYVSMVYPSIFQGMETLVIGNIPAMMDLPESQLRDTANRFIQYLTVSYLNSQNPDGIEDFYQISSDPQTERSYYETEVRQPYYPGDYCLEPARWEEYGFLDYDRDKYASIEGDMETWYYSLPNQETDLENFVMAILEYSTEEFELQYVQYPKVVDKFLLLKEILIKMGVVEQ